MRLSPYILNALKYATFTVAGLIVVVVFTYVTRGSDKASLAGRLVPVQSSSEHPAQFISVSKLKNGFRVPADTPVIFTMPGEMQPISIETFFGNSHAQFWVYEFSGNEEANAAAGKTGRQRNDGLYYFSRAEQENQVASRVPVSSDLLAIRKSILTPAKKARESDTSTLYPGKTYFVNAAADLIAGPDDDNDGLNNGQEAQYSTDPKIADTDKDSVSDGVEVVAGYNAREPDTDHDGLRDGCEDRNANGIQDTGTNPSTAETSPTNADTDHDTLCDGPSGSAPGCLAIVDTKILCSQNADNERVCRPSPSDPLHYQGEDLNGNCTWDPPTETSGTNPRTYGIDDIAFRENQFLSKYGISGMNAHGTTKSPFPIPAMPNKDL